MDGFYATAVILGLFLLRLGVPLLITAAVCYGLRRLDTRWQAEAEAERRNRQEVAVVNIGAGRH
ncbi:MAG: hypothetical protein DWI57_07430 [Chloroflexi bacterium]|nr:MAG: hypothetical protein DWI57_07430 [Chloroflexota bacterium]